MGFQKRHAYTVVDVYQNHNCKRIKLRNPWGDIEWNGKWSDNSKEYEDHKDM